MSNFLPASTNSYSSPAAHYVRYAKNDFIESNNAKFNDNKLSNVYSKDSNNQLSVSQEPDIKYSEVCNYVVISSKDRDLANYSKSNSYTIQLQKELKNVISVELVQAIIPDKNNVTEEPYLLLKVNELDSVMDSNDRNISDAFALLQLTCATVPNTFIQMDKRIHENVILYYRTPKASLSRMTVRITDSDGNPFEFGGDNSYVKAYQNTFVFKITTLEKNTSQLNKRNVY